MDTELLPLTQIKGNVTSNSFYEDFNRDFIF